MNYKTYADLSTDILGGIHKIPTNIELVVGIPRSGMIPAYMIATHLNLPVTSLDAYLLGDYGSFGERRLNKNSHDIKHVLVVDDSVYSGTAMEKAKIRLQEKGQIMSHLYCAVYSAARANNVVDFYFEYLPTPRAFQWNYKNHFITTKSCFDIDGVLCVDPTHNENDDGDKYKMFIANAKPLFIPKYKISCLVTSRLEKYRSETEAWLQKHDVDYGELIMLDLPNAKERRAQQIHARFKANIFKERYELYFVESNWKQAKTIFELTKKPVFCTENDVLINSFFDTFLYDSKSNEKGKVFFESYYNKTYQLDLSNYKSLFFYIMPPLVSKIVFKCLKRKK